VSDYSEIIPPPRSESPVSFKPQWGDYKTMRNRWVYIQPQVKRLQSQETILAPSNNDRCIVIGSRKNPSSPIKQNGYTILNGNLVDTSHFSYSISRSAQRNKNINLKSQDLCQYELDKQKSYTFSHAVRYG